MNPARLQAFRARVQAQMESFFPATIRIGETEYAAATSGLKRSEQTGSVGTFNLADDDISFRVRKELLVSVPAIGAQLVWVERSLTFRIIHTKNTEDTDPAWHLGCEAIVK